MFFELLHTYDFKLVTKGLLNSVNGFFKMKPKY